MSVENDLVVIAKRWLGTIPYSLEHFSVCPLHVISLDAHIHLLSKEPVFVLDAAMHQEVSIARNLHFLLQSPLWMLTQTQRPLAGHFHIRQHCKEKKKKNKKREKIRQGKEEEWKEEEEEEEECLTIQRSQSNLIFAAIKEKQSSIHFSSLLYHLIKRIDSRRKKWKKERRERRERKRRKEKKKGKEVWNERKCLTLPPFLGSLPPFHHSSTHMTCSWFTLLSTNKHVHWVTSQRSPSKSFKVLSKFLESSSSSSQVLQSSFKSSSSLKFFFFKISSSSKFFFVSFFLVWSISKVPFNGVLRRS